MHFINTRDCAVVATYIAIALHSYIVQYYQLHMYIATNYIHIY